MQKPGIWGRTPAYYGRASTAPPYRGELLKPPIKKRQPEPQTAGGWTYKPATKDNGQDGEPWPSPIGTAPLEWRLVNTYRRLDDAGRAEVLQTAVNAEAWQIAKPIDSF